MALTLNLDGKDIGKVDDSGNLIDSTGKPVVAQPPVTPDPDDPSKITVPLGPPSPVQTTPDPNLDPTKVDDPAKVVDPNAGVDPEVVSLKKQVAVFQKVIDQISAAPRTPQTAATIEQTKELIQDHIPEGLDKEKDPFGLAITLKSMVKALNNMNSKVERLDTHAGYQEGMRHLESAKNDYEIFKDQKLGPIANKVLQAELATSGDPIPLIVARVATQFEGIGTDGGESYVKKKTDQLKKVPGTVRSKDGVTAAITVDKPKNVTEAKEAYRAWRSARDKAQR